jgi:outer membrane immunogenic protein
MKRIVLTAAFVALGSASALAADLPSRGYNKAPAMAPVSNWSGLYIGGNVGYGWGNGSTGILPSKANDFSAASALDSRLKGVFGGAQIGYNWQIGSIVTGFEADIQSSGMRGSARAALINLGGAGPGDITASTSSELSWFGTVRGRLGVTVTPDLLLYGTGGLAYGRVKASANVQIDDPPFLDTWPASISSSTKTGWAAGAGAEWMFARNWSAKVEYLHIDLGSSSATALDIVAPGEVPLSGTTTYSWNHRYDTLRVGVNYHFN